VECLSVDLANPYPSNIHATIDPANHATTKPIHAIPSDTMPHHGQVKDRDTILCHTIPPPYLGGWPAPYPPPVALLDLIIHPSLKIILLTTIGHLLLLIGWRSINTLLITAIVLFIMGINLPGQLLDYTQFSTTLVTGFCLVVKL